MTLDLSTRALTDGELIVLKARLRSLRCAARGHFGPVAAARAFGVSLETLQNALAGRRVQCAKREKLLDRSV